MCVNIGTGCRDYRSLAEQQRGHQYTEWILDGHALCIRCGRSDSEPKSFFDGASGQAIDSDIRDTLCCDGRLFDRRWQKFTVFFGGAWHCATVVDRATHTLSSGPYTEQQRQFFCTTALFYASVFISVALYRTRYYLLETTAE